jgi:hypothetical protein
MFVGIGGLGMGALISYDNAAFGFTCTRYVINIHLWHEALPSVVDRAILQWRVDA